MSHNVLFPLFPLLHISSRITYTVASCVATAVTSCSVLHFIAKYLPVTFFHADSCIVVILQTSTFQVTDILTYANCCYIISISVAMCWCCYPICCKLRHCFRNVAFELSLIDVALLCQMYSANPSLVAYKN